MGCSKSRSKREVYVILPQETRKPLNDNLTLHLKQMEKEHPPQISRRKEIMKIRAEIREKEMKETIVMINKTRR